MVLCFKARLLVGVETQIESKYKMKRTGVPHGCYMGLASGSPGLEESKEMETDSIGFRAFG